ncbi:MAG: hypothetical protein OEZ01_08310, partial [Candidatus Heimdallarchaeota archaeon]|nr:hypothetical protein [Candidatus Heimdallarchaeota archaeon]
MPSKFGYLLIFACVVNIFNLANELTFQNFLFLVAIGLLPLLEIYDEKWNINNDNILSKLMSLSIVSKFMFFVISFSICYSIAFNQFGFNDLALIVIPTIIIIGEYKYGKNIKFLQDYTSTNAHVANNEIVLNPTFNSGSLPIKLRKNEFIILSEFVVLNEKRSHYVHGSRKYKISGYNETLWTVQGRGHLIITNQRMLYQGNNKREYKLEEIYKIQTWIKKKGLFIQKKIPSGIVIDSSKYARQHMYESIHPYFWIKAFQEKSNIEQQVYAQLHQQQEYQYTVNNPVMTNKTGYECSHCGSIVNTKFCTSCGIERIDNSSRPDWQTMDGKQFEEF